MAPLSTVFSVLTLALAAVGTQGAAAALHNTRSRQHSADLAARRVGAIAPRDVALQAANNDSAAHKKRTQKKKRCDGHKSTSAAEPTHTSSASSGGSTGKSTGSSGSSTGGSGSSGSSGSSGDGGVSGLKWVGKPTSGFVGEQTGAIMSWFRADSSQDSTNGESWCGNRYDDSQPLFAPDMKIMSPSLATWTSDASQWEHDAGVWCGAQAIVTYKGRQTVMYIGDAFAPEWVRTETSIDVLYDVFVKAYGSDPDDNKDIVGEGVSWELTGYYNPAYMFQAS